MKQKLITLIKENEKKLLIFSFFYIVAVCIYMIVHRSWFSPDQFFAFALIGSFAIGRLKFFIFDWLPFILFFIGYELLRGIVPHIIGGVHIFPMIRFDEFIFGSIPTIKLQTLFYNPNKLTWYDYFLVICYISYFVVPMIVGYFLWIKDRQFFKKYSNAILVLAYISFLTFIIFPAMPPWMAASKGYLPPVEEVTGVVMAHFLPSHISFPTIYSLVAADPVAAVPSLHAAMPFLIFLFLYKRYKKKGLIILPYVIGTWIAVIYLGEHYFMDVLIGVIYAVGVFLLITNWQRVKLTLQNSYRAISSN